MDKSGVSPLHRAVRTRSLPAVQALLDGGANVTAPNKAGSTLLHLAVQNTGRGGSGSRRAEQQTEIIRLLLLQRRTADGHRWSRQQVRQACQSEWVRSVIEGSGAD